MYLLNEKPLRSLIIAFTIISVFLGTTGVCHALKAADYDQATKVFKGSPETKRFFDNAYGYAIFPLIGKGGIGIGASFGKGQVYRQGKLTGYVHLVDIPNPASDDSA